jgi:hypothetical protein
MVARLYICIPKSQFGYIFDGLGMEDVGIFYGHLEYLRPFGVSCGNLVHFFRFGLLCREKSGNPVLKEFFADGFFSISHYRPQTIQWQLNDVHDPLNQ